MLYNYYYRGMKTQLHLWINQGQITKYLLAHHINATMETMVDLVISNDRVAPRSDLHPSQCIAMDVVVL